MPGPLAFHLVRSTLDRELPLTGLQKKEVSPMEINPPISLERKGRRPHVDLLSELLTLLNNRLDKWCGLLSESLAEEGCSPGRWNAGKEEEEAHS